MKTHDEFIQSLLDQNKLIEEQLRNNEMPTSDKEYFEAMGLLQTMAMNLYIANQQLTESMLQMQVVVDEMQEKLDLLTAMDPGFSGVTKKSLN